MTNSKQATRKIYKSNDNGNSSLFSEAIAYAAVTMLVPMVVISSAAFLI